MASLRLHQLPHTHLLLLIKTLSLAGQPPSKVGQLTHLQPHRHYQCLLAARSRLATTGAATQHEHPPMPIRSRTTSPLTPLFPLRQYTILGILRRTVSVDTILHRAFTQTPYRRHQKFLLMHRPSVRIPSPRAPSPTPLPSLTATSISRHTTGLPTTKTSCSMTL